MTFPFPFTYRRPPTLTIISAALGTVINLNMAFNPGNAFDGNTANGSGAGGTDGAQSTGRGGSTSGFANAVGKDWGAGVTKTITQFELYSCAGTDFLTSGGSTSFKLQGSPDNSTWTDLTSAASTGTGSNIHLIVSSGITTTTAYRYHRINLNGNGTNEAAIAEIIFYETI